MSANYGNYVVFIRFILGLNVALVYVKTLSRLNASIYKRLQRLSEIRT